MSSNNNNSQQKLEEAKKYVMKVDYEADDDIVVINGKIETRGALSYSIERIEYDNDYGLKQEGYEIRGVLVVPYYTQDIDTIETKRYLLQMVDVEKEEFGSKEDNVVYRFTCEISRVKYQTGEYKEI